MNVLHLATSVGLKSFGIGTVVLNIAAAQILHGITPNIWCCDLSADAAQFERECELLPDMVRSFRVTGPSMLGFSFSMEKAASKEASLFSILHQHGIWTGKSRTTCRWRSLTRKPTVITPHGSLEPWALNRSSIKKKIALFFYESDNLYRASCMHALSHDEASAFRSFGLTNPIAVIPNGISEGWLDSDGSSTRFRQRFGISVNTNLLLFLGRITPIKGLMMLLRAISDQRDVFTDFKLFICGVDEFGHKEELQKLVRRLSLQAHVEFPGPMYGQMKRDAYAAADLFVLPSYSEGAPMTILEALGAGVPVLTTKASPWEDLIRHKCGWWTEICEDAIGLALRDALQTPREELREMGRRGKALVSTKYTWTEVAKETLSLYNWLLGKAERPDFVYLD